MAASRLPTNPLRLYHNGYSIPCYIGSMSQRSEVLAKVMRETSTDQSSLALLSGVKQPSLSQYLSSRVEFSDSQLERLLACMGRTLEIERHATTPELTRAERRSWLLHRELARLVDLPMLTAWTATIERNLDVLLSGVTGEPHVTHLKRWQQLVQGQDLPAIRRVLTGLDRTSIEMREVSPLSGILPEETRHKVLAEAR